MTRRFCDRCPTEITALPVGAILGIADADPDRNGTITHDFDVCPECYQAWLTFMKPARKSVATTAPPAKRARSKKPPKAAKVPA